MILLLLSGALAQGAPDHGVRFDPPTTAEGHSLGISGLDALTKANVDATAGQVDERALSSRGPASTSVTARLVTGPTTSWVLS